MLQVRGLHRHFQSEHTGSRSAFGVGLTVVLFGAGFVVRLVGVVRFHELYYRLLLSPVVGRLLLLSLCLLSLSLQVLLVERVGGVLGRVFSVSPMVSAVELVASLLPSLVQIV